MSDVCQGVKKMFAQASKICQIALETMLLFTASKDPVARKLRLRRRRDKQDESEKVLKGMRDVAKEKDKAGKSAQVEEEAKARK